VFSFDLTGQDVVVDLGCGTNQLTLRMAAWVCAVVGVDPEPDMLQVRATERVAAMGIAEEDRRVLAVIYEMLEAQELGNVGRVLETYSERPEAAHMATDGIKWETSSEAAQAVTAVPGDGLRLVADHFDVHLQGGVAWVAGLGRLINRSGAERPVRMSGVLVREHGQWVIVQSHASLPVQDSEIFKLAVG
jgi:SAM-dependent methyltransferase